MSDQPAPALRAATEEQNLRDAALLCLRCLKSAEWHLLATGEVQCAECKIIDLDLSWADRNLDPRLPLPHPHVRHELS